MQATVVAALHVGILVLSRDLGSAVIFFAAYLVMLYVSTKKPQYLGLGLAGGSLGAVVAYFLFGHVRQRVSAWRDPMAVYQNEAIRSSSHCLPSEQAVGSAWDFAGFAGVYSGCKK